VSVRSILLGVLLLLGCAGADDPPGTAAPGDGPGTPSGPTRASREAAARGRAESPVAPSSAAAPPAAARPLFVARPVDVQRGEDGRGATVPATRPVALDVDATRFPARALDPVLLVGALRFADYTYPRPGVLRFVAADASALPDGVEVAIQYGDDPSTRQVVAPALDLP